MQLLGGQRRKLMIVISNAARVSESYEVLDLGRLEHGYELGYKTGEGGLERICVLRLL